MIFTVTFSDASVVEVYGGLPACDAYLFQTPGAAAAAYLALDPDSDARKRLLVAATRYIDRQRWQGTANGAGGTTLAFPRDGLEDAAGEPATNEYQLALVQEAAFELTALFAVEEDARTNPDQSSNIKRMKAGSAELELFSPTSIARGTATKLPSPAMELIGQWLAGSGGVGMVTLGGSSTGTCGESRFDGKHGYKRNEAF